MVMKRPLWPHPGHQHALPGKQSNTRRSATWYLIIQPKISLEQGREVTQDRFMCYRIYIVGNLVLEVVGKARTKLILRVWLAQTSA